MKTLPKKVIIYIVYIIILLFPPQAYTEWIITTIAGTGEAGFSGDGGNATNAKLNHPYRFALDSQGNIYFADANNNRIRKISTNGTITTIAGTGDHGFSGDGSAATSAKLYSPRDILIDSRENIFIADSHNHRIRKISPNGIISTCASGSKYFMGIAYDSQENLYIANSHNHNIKKVLNNGNLITVAGTGSGSYSGDGNATSENLYYPWGLAIDKQDNIFIADSHNHRIRKVTPNGKISTIGGTGSKGFSGDGNAAISAELYYPWDVTLDNQGNLYIADSHNHCIRKISTNGIISTVAGTGGKNGYSGDGGPATSAKLYYPYGIEVDSFGNIYIGDSSNNRIRKVYNNQLTLTIPPQTHELQETLTAKIEIIPPQYTDITINLSSSDPTELKVPSTVTIPAQKSSATFTISVLDDIQIDGDQQVSITAQQTGWATHTVKTTVKDNEPGEIQFKSATYLVDHDGEITIPVIRTVPSYGPISIKYTTKPKTAVPEEDYVPVSGTLYFDSDDQIKTFAMTILDNPSHKKQDRLIELKLSEPGGGATLGPVHTALLTIAGTAPVILPYTATFNEYMPGNGWTLKSSNSMGRIHCLNNIMQMDSIWRDEQVLSEAQLMVNMAWVNDVYLSFDAHFLDELSTTIPETYTDQYMGTGVSISMDGYTWYKAVRLEHKKEVHHSINLDNTIKNIQQQYTNDFQYDSPFYIKFQSMATAPYPALSRWRHSF